MIPKGFARLDSPQEKEGAMTVECLQLYPRTSIHFTVNAPATAEVTFAAWLKFDLRTFGLLFDWEGGEGEDFRRGAIGLREGRLILLESSAAGSATEGILTPEDVGIQDGHWHYVAVSIGGGRAVVYKDGKAVAETALDPSREIRMGKCGPVMWGVARPPREGAMHSARIWRRALSAAELALAWRGNGPHDTSELLVSASVAAGVIENKVTGEQLPVTGTRVANLPFVTAPAGNDAFVISALNVTLTKDMLPAGQDVSVFADTLTLDSPLCLAGNSMNVFARVMIANTGASIDLTGADGTSQPGQAGKGPNGQNPGDPGGVGLAGAGATDGLPGGNLTVLAGTIHGTLPVTSNGGLGGSGQQGGPGGDGVQGSTGSDQSCSNGNTGDGPRPAVWVGPAAREEQEGEPATGGMAET